MSAIKINGATSGSTTITAPDTGSDESIELSTALAAKLPIAGGKILQMQTATDTSNRTTTSTSFTDVTNMSVSITPQKSDSALLIVCTFYARASDGAGNTARARYVITDSSNTAISGTQNMEFEVAAAGATNMLINTPATMIAYTTPATTSAVSYKLRFAAASGDTAEVRGGDSTSRIYAFEVSA
jgi:hypothetical protein